MLRQYTGPVNMTSENVYRNSAQLYTDSLDRNIWHCSITFPTKLRLSRVFVPSIIL